MDRFRWFALFGAAIVCLEAMPVEAALQSRSGRFYDVSYDDTQLPSTDWRLDMSSELTVIAGADPTTSPWVIVNESLRIANINPAAGSNWVMDFALIIHPKPMATFSSGREYQGRSRFEGGVVVEAPVELLTTTVRVLGRTPRNVASSGVNTIPSFASFATAVGSNALSVSLASVSGGPAVGKTDSGFYLDPVALGDTRETFMPAEADRLDGPWLLTLHHVVSTPTFAAASTTVPHCRELSCMDFADGQYTQTAYTIGFNVLGSGFVTRSPLAPVPEPTAWSVLAAGLGMIATILRRRRQAPGRR